MGSVFLEKEEENPDSMFSLPMRTQQEGRLFASQEESLHQEQNCTGTLTLDFSSPRNKGLLLKHQKQRSTVQAT